MKKTCVLKTECNMVCDITREFYHYVPHNTPNIVKRLLNVRVIMIVGYWGIKSDNVVNKYTRGYHMYRDGANVGIQPFFYRKDKHKIL